MCVVYHSVFDHRWSLDDELLSKDKFSLVRMLRYIIGTKKIQQNDNWEIAEAKWLLFCNDQTE